MFEYCVFFLFFLSYNENVFAEKSWENSTVTVHLEKADFDTAKQRCIDDGGRLVMLNTKRLVRFINQSISNKGKLQFFLILMIFILTTIQRL